MYVYVTSGKLTVLAHFFNTKCTDQNSFTDTFISIMSNSIPNETERFVLRDPPWITKPLKTMLNRKNRLFKNYKKMVIKLRIKLGSMQTTLILPKNHFGKLSME